MKPWIKFVSSFFAGGVFAVAIGGYWLYDSYQSMEWYLKDLAEVKIAFAANWIAQTDPVHASHVERISQYLDGDALKNEFRIHYSTNSHIFLLEPLANINEASPIFISEVGNTNFNWTSTSSMGDTPEQTLSTFNSWHSGYNTTTETNRVDVGGEMIPYLYSPDGEGGSVLSVVVTMADKEMLVGILGFKYSDDDFLRDEVDTTINVLKYRAFEHAKDSPYP